MAKPNATESDTDTRVWVIIRNWFNPDWVLLGKRSAQCNNPGTYGLFGGHLDAGEDMYRGAIRELQEETTIKVSRLDIMHVDSAQRKGATLNYFEVRSLEGFLDVEGPRLPVTDEVDSYVWWSCKGHEFVPAFSLLDENPQHRNSYKMKPEMLHYSALMAKNAILTNNLVSI